MTASDLELRKIMLLSARPKNNALLSDLIRYEKITGEKMGKGIVVLKGREDESHFLKSLENIWPEIPAKADVSEYLKDIAWAASVEMQQNQGTQTMALLGLLEHTFTNSTEDAQKLVVSFLEDLQTLYINLDLKNEEIDLKMPTHTKTWWDEIARFWNSAALWMQSNPTVNPKRDEVLAKIKTYLNK